MSTAFGCWIGKGSEASVVESGRGEGAGQVERSGRNEVISCSKNEGAGQEGGGGSGRNRTEDAV